MNETEMRILPADVFDTLELSALAYKGIGQPGVFDYGDDGHLTPVCVHAHGSLAADWTSFGGPISDILYTVGLKGFESDRAVRVINRRKGRPLTSRVTWREFAKETRLIRGD